MWKPCGSPLKIPMVDTVILRQVHILKDLFIKLHPIYTQMWIECNLSTAYFSSNWNQFLLTMFHTAASWRENKYRFHRSIGVSSCKELYETQTVLYKSSWKCCSSWKYSSRMRCSFIYLFFCIKKYESLYYLKYACAYLCALFKCACPIATVTLKPRLQWLNSSFNQSLV